MCNQGPTASEKNFSILRNKGVLTVYCHFGEMNNLISFHNDILKEKWETGVFLKHRPLPWLRHRRPRSPGLVLRRSADRPARESAWSQRLVPGRRWPERPR